MPQEMIEIDDSALRRYFDKLIAMGTSMRPVMAEIGAAMRLSTRGRFDSQTGPDGKRWTPLKAATIRAKRQRKDRILEERLTLRDSINYRADDTSVVWGTNVKYAGAHQFGAEIKKGERLQRVRLRLDRKGQLLRQGTSGRSRNLARFARKSHRRALEREARVGAHTIGIPARPFLGFSEGDRRETEAILQDNMKP